MRGRSAKRIAEELFISENTVWTHTKNVYAKTKVSGKDDLMNLFEDEAFGR
ncbi:MAG: helix-turn-helix transcriptional regulator [Slackia sp.]